MHAFMHIPSLNSIMCTFIASVLLLEHLAYKSSAFDCVVLKFLMLIIFVI